MEVSEPIILPDGTRRTIIGGGRENTRDPEQQADPDDMLGGDAPGAPRGRASRPRRPPPAYDAPPAPASSPTAPATRRGFDRARLWAPDPDRAAWYEMPGGRGRALGAAAGRRRAAPDKPADRGPGARCSTGRTGSRRPPRARSSAGGRSSSTRRSWRRRRSPWSVCCRTGPAPDAPRVFADADLEAFHVNPGWDLAAQEIAALSDQLGRGRRRHAALLREALRGPSRRDRDFAGADVLIAGDGGPPRTLRCDELGGGGDRGWS